MDRRYYVKLFWSDEDDCWVAKAPEVRHVMAHGDTPEEALKNIDEALTAALQVLQAQGRPLPEPETAAHR